MSYYDSIAEGYDTLYKEEQLIKLGIIMNKINITSDDRVLDVGCGTAFSFDMIINLGARVQGVEPSKGLIKKSRYSEKITNAKAEKLPFPDNLFTVVISVTALQNFEEPRKGLEEMKRVCSDRLAITFLKKSSKRPLLESLIKELFLVKEVVDEGKDLIFFCLVKK